MGDAVVFLVDVVNLVHANQVHALLLVMTDVVSRY